MKFGDAVASRVEVDSTGGSVHDKLVSALIAESELLPKRGRGGAPWYDRDTAVLEPLRESRNRAVAKFMTSRPGGKERAKQRLKEVRQRWRSEVKAAKSA